MKVYLGYDSHEPTAYEVAVSSLVRRASATVSVTPLDIRRLESWGLLRRPTDLRGQRYDLPSNAPASTEFAISRFLVPMLAQTGWALFADSDVVFLDDVAELFGLADPQYAVMCVQHAPQAGALRKMDGQIQLPYPRKNWSSVVLWNCDHPANRRLSLVDVQERRGFDLHQFYWLADSEIGALPAQWNWLVNVEPMPTQPKLAHFTLGGPFTPGWEGADHDSLWFQEQSWLKHPSDQARVSKASSMSSEGVAA
jgi:lipopolysaccharide biosynthesis glycosyltransferase